MRIWRLREVFWLLILVFCALQSDANSEQVSQREAVAMRLIGHEFLLTMGDSTSRVLPIRKVGERFEISFENEFTFVSDSLVSALDRAMSQSKISENYILEIQKCGTDSIVHALAVGSAAGDLLPCGIRNQPVDCYQFYFTNLDVDITETETQVKAKEPPYSMSFLVTAGIILLVFSYLLFKKKPEPTEEPKSEGVEIGDYFLEPNSMKLILKESVEQLSGKECELLLLLNRHRNQNVEREVILKEVWGDEGDYVGRTLDVFISKLRKKLSSDSNIEIKNIRGVGYRLVVA